jgi:Fe-S cluster assembly ATP-binding protein
MLSVKSLTVKAQQQTILKDINLDIKDGEEVVLFGPNGCGKSTLFKVIMGLDGYEILKGDIEIDRKSVKGKSIDERVKLGLGYVGQKGVGIKGVTVEDLMDQYDFKYEDVKKDIDSLDISELLNRDINYTLSGGEIKRVELFTLSLLKNIQFYLLDELDSGVDLENISKIARYLKKLSKEKSIVITTHTGAILKELDVDTAYVMLDGEIVCKGKPKKVWDCIKKQGYEGCLTCDFATK